MMVAALSQWHKPVQSDTYTNPFGQENYWRGRFVGGEEQQYQVFTVKQLRLWHIKYATCSIIQTCFGVTCRVSKDLGLFPLPFSWPLGLFSAPALLESVLTSGSFQMGVFTTSILRARASISRILKGQKRLAITDQHTAMSPTASSSAPNATRNSL